MDVNKITMKFMRNKIGVAVFIVALGSASVSNSASLPTMKVDCLMVTNARIALRRASENVTVKSWPPHLSQANYGQEIEAGHLRVLAIRIYEDDGRAVDSQKFSKITLELVGGRAALAAGESEKVEISRGYYSHGGVGFIPQGEYWWAHDPIKNINLTQTDKGLTVALNSKFLVAKASDGESKEMVVDLSCPVRSVSVENLGPWEGKISAGWSPFSPK